MKGSPNRNVRWHQKHLKKRAQANLRRKEHTTEWRETRAYSIARQNAEESYRAAIKHEKLLRVGGWFKRQWLKFIYRIKMFLNYGHNESKTQEN